MNQSFEKLPIDWKGNHGSTCASDLGWEPGNWPQRPTLKLKSGSKLVLNRIEIARDGEGDVTHATYTTGDCIVTVFND